MDNMTPGPRAALGVLAGGILGMMVAMAIGRFVFAPILPMMQRDLGLTHATAGYLASLNYLGYLAGALGCSLRPVLLRSGSFNLGALVISVGTTFLMGRRRCLRHGGFSASCRGRPARCCSWRSRSRSPRRWRTQASNG